MAGADGHADADLTGVPVGEMALRADFFETVRLLGLASDGAAPAGPVGGDRPPAAEPVRFVAADGFRHPDGEIVRLDRDADGPATLAVGFMGLTGPSGVMPDHYTETILARGRQRDAAMQRFMDLFNHRAVSLFYRAWAKYRLPVQFAATGGDLSDPVSRALAAIAGVATAPDDPRMLAAAGALSRRVRSPSALRRSLALLFDLPVTVIELMPRRIRIDPADQTRLGGAFSALGRTAVAGVTAMDIAGRFRLRIGPLDHARFQSFFDDGGVRRRLVETVRLAVGATASFDLQLVLRGAEVPVLRLGDPAAPVRLGQNSWLCDAPPPGDRDDAVLPGRIAA